MKYLLDSNTFIEAKNRYYGMDFCPAYWEWIINENESANIWSIKPVFDELSKGKDGLATWAKANEKIFLDVSDDRQTQKKYAEIGNHLQKQASKMKLGAFDEFLKGADLWLIAKASVTQATIVTQEAYKENCKRKFLIPNVCKDFGVDYMNSFELLRNLRAKFIL